MELFPVGLLSAASGTGMIDAVLYPFFEPNKGVSSNPVYTELQTKFGNQTVLTRKTAEPFLTIKYDYSNIFASEYRQIEHFIASKDDAVISFYVVDLNQGEVPTAINTSSTWIPSIANTRLYDTIINQKANYIFFNNGISWKIGTVTTVTENTSVTTDVDTNNFGTLSDTDGAIIAGDQRVHIYPMYTCYLTPGSLQNFKQSGYWSNDDSDRGPVYSGSISFVSKYKI